MPGTQTHFVVRAAQNRRIQAGEHAIGHLLDHVRTWPSQGQQPFDVPASHGRQARQTTLQISFGPATLLPPWNDPRGRKDPLPVWVVRVWETAPPTGEEALEWMLLTSLETATCEHAWQRVNWYRCRWIVEEYHQCLKTGCRLEERSLRTIERMIRLLGLLSPIAVRLLHLRDVARYAPESQASQSLEPEAVALIAASLSLPQNKWPLPCSGRKSRGWAGIWGADEMDHQAGKPSGRAGCICKLCWKGFIWRLTSVCKMWVKDRLLSTGLSGPLL